LSRGKVLLSIVLRELEHRQSTTTLLLTHSLDRTPCTHW
jgi:hypothetical protein